MPPSHRPGSAWDSSSRSQFPPSYHSSGGPPSYRTTPSSTASSVGQAPPSYRTPSSSTASSAGRAPSTHRTPTSPAGSAMEVFPPHSRSSASRARISSFSQFTPCEGSSPTYHYNFIYRSEDSSSREREIHDFQGGLWLRCFGNLSSI